MAKIRIDKIDDVTEFLRHIVLTPEQKEGALGMGWNFHPDDDLQDEELNASLDRCFEVCEKFHKDIYKLTLDILKAEC